MTDQNDEPQKEDGPTKSELKRKMTALQKLGETLVNLPEIQLKKIPLDDTLKEAIYLARSLKSHEAKRRQLQYIGKIMRDRDPAPFQIALEASQGKDIKAKAKFHQIERWRDKLIAEGDTVLNTLAEQYPDIDRQHIRQLIRKAQHDLATQKHSGADTELFRYLRTLILDE